MTLVDSIVNDLLLPSKKALLSILSNNENNFYVLILNKNTKNERVVFAPKKITKTCQKYILNNYLSELTTSDSVVSYKKNKSIVNVALPHLGNKHFLHLDIKHYFNRMRWDKFKEIIEKYYPNSKFCFALKNYHDERFLRKVLCFKDKIVQGSVTSPCISNIYLRELDEKICNYIKNIKDGVYTRYSDDLIISSSAYIDNKIIDVIQSVLKEFNLRLNYKKIDYTKLKNTVRITGLSLNSNKEITLNTSYKKNLKTAIYKTLKSNGKGVNFNALYGKINYLKSVDPKYFNFLQEKYRLGSKYLMDRLNEINSTTKKQFHLKT